MNIHPLSEKRLEDYYQSALTLLKALIRTPSLSKEEGQTGALLSDKLEAHGIYFERKHHNLWMRNKHFHLDKPTLLLNSHHDTVRPNEGYTLDPFDPQVKEGKLLGLGSNDAGASLVALISLAGSRGCPRIHICVSRSIGCLLALSSAVVADTAMHLYRSVPVALLCELA